METETKNYGGDNNYTKTSISSCNQSETRETRQDDQINRED